MPTPWRRLPSNTERRRATFPLNQERRLGDRSDLQSRQIRPLLYHTQARRRPDCNLRADGLSLELESPNWKLERGKQYLVKMKLGPINLDAELAAEPNAVSMDIRDTKLEAGLRSASVMHIVAAGAIIKVPLDKSTAAFERLEQCVEKNNKAIETNPFVAPAPQP